MPPRLSDLVLDTQIRVECHGTAHHRFTFEPITTVSGGYARRRETQHIWTKERLLGKGSYGEVYLHKCSTDGDRNELQAVKMIDKSLMARQRINYHKEVEAIAKFSQQKYRGLFVEYKVWYEIDESVFIAMEFIENGDLDSKLTEPLPEEEARTITLQLVEGLIFLHENNFVHRDFKPKNIFVVQVGPEWRVKLGDFGISKRINEDSTLSGGGTPLFMAPEMRGYLPPEEEDSSITFQFTESIDIWSLGVTSFFLLFHDYPFTSKQPHKLPRYIAGGKFPFPTTNAPSLSQDCYRFLEGAMGRHPRNRLSAKEALESRWLNSLENNYQETTNGLDNPSKDSSHHITVPLMSEQLSPKKSADMLLISVGSSSSTKSATPGSDVSHADGFDNAEGPTKTFVNQESAEKRSPKTLDTDSPTGSSSLESKDPLSFMPSSSLSSRSGDEITEEKLPQNGSKNAISNFSSRIPGSIAPDVDPEKAMQNKIANMSALYDRGTTLFEANKYDEARELLEGVLKSQRKILGMDNGSTLKTCHALGKILYTQKRYGRALTYFILCANEQEKLHGKLHSNSLRARFWIGRAELRLGNLESAEAILKEVVTDQQALLGPLHKNTLETNHEIGLSLLAQKKWALARFFFEIAHNGRQKIFGSNHRETIDSLAYTGYTYQKFGNHEKAVSTLKKVLNVWRGKRGLWEIDTIRAACILGESLYELKEFPEATSTLQDALSRAKSAETTDDPQILRGSFFLGNCLVGLNDYHKANFAYRDAAEGQKKALGPDDLETLESVYHVGFTHMKLGQYISAHSPLESVKKACMADGRLIPGYHSLYIRSNRDLGFVHYALRQYVEANLNLTIALDGFTNLYGSTHETTLFCLFWLCKVQYEMEMLEGAETTCRKLIVSETEAYEYPKPETLDILEMIVKKLYWQHSLVKAKSLCQLLMDLRGLKGESLGSRIEARNLMSVIEQAMGEHGEDVPQEKPQRKRFSALFKKR